MKTAVTIILLGAMTLSLPARNFTIKGHFTDVANDTVLMVLIEYVKREPEKRVVNECIPVDANGFFNYGCDIRWAYNAELTVQSNGNNSYLFFVPGESVEIEGPSGLQHHWNIDGSAFYQRLSSVNRLQQPFYEEFDAARSRYARARPTGSTERCWIAKGKRPMSI